MGKFEIKSPAPGLYIPSQYALEQQMRAAVMAERVRQQDYYYQRHEVFMAQHLKLNELAMALDRVEHAALWATGETLEKALAGQVEKLSGLLGGWLEAVYKLDFVDELSQLPEVNKWVALHNEGIIRATNKNYEYYDSGDLLRELGRKADAGYNALANARAEIDKGGAPVKQWRMILAQRVEAIQSETGATQHGALNQIMDEIKFMDEPSEEWLTIFQEIDKRKRQKRINWIKRIMSDYHDMSNLMVK